MLPISNVNRHQLPYSLFHRADNCYLYLLYIEHGVCVSLHQSGAVCDRLRHRSRCHGDETVSQVEPLEDPFEFLVGVERLPGGSLGAHGHALWYPARQRVQVYVLKERGNRLKSIIKFQLFLEFLESQTQHSKVPVILLLGLGFLVPIKT